MALFPYLMDPLPVAKVQKYFGVQQKTKRKRLRSNGSPEESDKEITYEITNKFWFYLFSFGTCLGDELFYTSFIPFWFWNVDGFVGRRFVLVWAIVMYIGQSIKDMVCWPRPGHPVVQLQSKWALEYGMPSTHAMVGVSIPFSILLYTMPRYQYNVLIGLVIAVLWCSVICISRLYLGMHTILDIIAGLVLTKMLMIPLIPLVDHLDKYIVTSPIAPILLLLVSILMITYYPQRVKWTPTRGDTTMIVSVCVGIQIGAWLNYQLGTLTHNELPPPYAISQQSLAWLFYVFLRTLLGFAMVILTKQIAGKCSYWFLCVLLQLNADSVKKSKNTLQNKHKAFVELGCKYITCGLIGFNMLYSIPLGFQLLNIDRQGFHTEI